MRPLSCCTSVNHDRIGIRSGGAQSSCAPPARLGKVKEGRVQWDRWQGHDADTGFGRKFQAPAELPLCVSVGLAGWPAGTAGASFLNTFLYSSILIYFFNKCSKMMSLESLMIVDRMPALDSVWCSSDFDG